MSLQKEKIWTQHAHIQRKDHMRTEEKVAVCQSRREVSEEIKPADTLISEIQPLELQECKCLLFKAPSLWYFVRAATGN